MATIRRTNRRRKTLLRNPPPKLMKELRIQARTRARQRRARA